MEYINKTIREFNVGLVHYINSSPLPIEIKRLIVQDTIKQLNSLAEEAISNEVMESEKELENSNNESEEKEEISDSKEGE